MPRRLQPPFSRWRSIPRLPRHQLPEMLEALSYGGRITADVLAHRFGWGDANALRRFVKRQTGKTITAHLQVARVRRARRLLLRNPKWPIERIARSVGWQSRSHFSRVFKELTGLSPKVYREVRFQARRESKV